VNLAPLVVVYEEQIYGMRCYRIWRRGRELKEGYAIEIDDSKLFHSERDADKSSLDVVVRRRAILSARLNVHETRPMAKIKRNPGCFGSKQRPLDVPYVGQKITFIPLGPERSLDHIVSTAAIDAYCPVPLGSGDQDLIVSVSRLEMMWK
jgi:hypothetical protein